MRGKTSEVAGERGVRVYVPVCGRWCEGRSADSLGSCGWQRGQVCKHLSGGSTEAHSCVAGRRAAESVRAEREGPCIRV